MDYLQYIVGQIHTVVAATVDDEGLPVTCAIDIMDADEKGLYFLTAKGKNFYRRLNATKYIAFTGIKGNSTMSSVAVSVGGKVREMGSGRLADLFAKNPYMAEIYPTAESRKALTVFCIYQGRGQWFDLSQKPIIRADFTFGDLTQEKNGYFINEKCVGCGRCLDLCPQQCIVRGTPFRIEQEHCLHCGNCREVCPAKAVDKRG